MVNVFVISLLTKPIYIVIIEKKEENILLR